MSEITRMPRTQLMVVTAAIILIAELFANEIIAGDDPDAGGWIGLSAFGIAVLALLVLVVVPRVAQQQRRSWTLGLGVTAIITCAVFWSALPFAFGAATLAAAAPGEEHPGETGEASASAGVILAALAYVVAFVLCLIG
jgi:hypothetical protein